MHSGCGPAVFLTCFLRFAGRPLVLPQPANVLQLRRPQLAPAPPPHILPFPDRLVAVPPLSQDGRAPAVAVTRPIAPTTLCNTALDGDVSAGTTLWGVCVSTPPPVCHSAAQWIAYSRLQLLYGWHFPLVYHTPVITLDVPASCCVTDSFAPTVWKISYSYCGVHR